MIVAGGILAALPFRRTEPINESSFDSAPKSPTTVTNPSYPSPVGMLVDQAEPADEWLARLAPTPATTTPPFPVHRELSAPLTYEQLAVPISRPEIIEQRFTAAEEVGPVESKHRRPNAAQVPSTSVHQPTQGNHSLVVAGPPKAIKQIESVLIGEITETVSLASTPLGEKSIEQLPKKSESTRERFWIRQP